MHPFITVWYQIFLINPLKVGEKSVWLPLKDGLFKRKYYVVLQSWLRTEVLGKLQLSRGPNIFVEGTIFHLSKALQGMWKMMHNMPFGVREEHGTRLLWNGGTRQVEGQGAAEAALRILPSA